MANGKIPVIFFGSGPVASASLLGILSDFEIELVITKPKPPHHRGSAPVEELAKSHGLLLAFAGKKSEVDKILAGKKIKSSVGLIIDYGVLISEEVIKKFPHGIINSHFSLLPRWRGADPITYCLLAGDSQTGVSLMKIVPKLEEGPIIAQEKMPVRAETNVLQLTDQLVGLSNSMVKKYLPVYLAGQLTAQPQSDTGITYSHKIKKSDGVIDWNKPAVRIEREVRAYAGWPKSRTTLAGKDIIITKARALPIDGKPGKVEIANENELIVYCGDGHLNIEQLQPAGKKDMSAAEFLRGYSIFT